MIADLKSEPKIECIFGYSLITKLDPSYSRLKSALRWNLLTRYKTLFRGKPLKSVFVRAVECEKGNVAGLV